MSELSQQRFVRTAKGKTSTRPGYALRSPRFRKFPGVLLLADRDPGGSCVSVVVGIFCQGIFRTSFLFIATIKKTIESTVVRSSKSR